MKSKILIAKKLHLDKNYEGALKIYSELLSSKWIVQNKNSKIELLQLQSILFLQLKKYEDAVTSLNEAILISPNNASNFYNRGLAFQELGMLQEAEDSYEQAISIKADYGAAYSNLGTVAKELKKYNKSIDAYMAAIQIDPKNYRNYSNVALTLMDGEYFEDALKYLDIAISRNSNDYQIYVNKGHVLYYLKRYDESLKCYIKAYDLKSDADWLLGLIYFGKLLICEWSSVEEIEKQIIFNSQKGLLEIDPFKALSLCDDPEIQKIIASNYYNAKYNLTSESIENKCPKVEKHRYKIGYYSSDFYNHATMHLMLELFDLHDKNKFDIHIFNYGLNKEDSYTLEIKNKNLKYINVSNWTDLEISNYSKEIGIDIAIDLKGFTSQSRVGIFAKRCGKIQINFLGFPGTMGVSCYDYIVADKVIVPSNMAKNYSEKIILMPDCYQVNNKIVETRDFNLSREHYGLPENGFVYCCFNNNYKIKSDVFKIWMEILLAVDGSVLWLLEDNQYASANLKAEAIKQGVSPDRIIFAQRAETPEHMYRHKFADLSLDTFPVNAHTTASDALKNSLPILTYCGKSFASRVAASLLSCLNLKELITYSLDDYKRKAIDLGLNPDLNYSLKNKLLIEIPKSNLYKPRIFVANLESAFEKILSEQC